METAVATSSLATPVASRADDSPKMSIRNLDFFYGKFQALKDVNLEIAERHVTAFIGPSGCGKSTLLRTLNRMYSLYPVSAVGGNRFEGQNILDAGVDINRAGRVGMVPASTPFPMSIHDNTAFGVRLLKNFRRARWTTGRMGLLTKGRCGRSEGQAKESGMAFSSGSSNGCASHAPWRSPGAAAGRADLRA
jgi:phosphate transport system ATP-binding protein